MAGLSVSERQRRGRFKDVHGYISARVGLPTYFYNGCDLRKIAKACNITIDEVRGQLRSLGYVLQENKKGIKIWRLPNDKNKMQSLRE